MAVGCRRCISGWPAPPAGRAPVLPRPARTPFRRAVGRAVPGRLRPLAPRTRTRPGHRPLRAGGRGRRTGASRTRPRPVRPVRSRPPAGRGRLGGSAGPPSPPGRPRGGPGSAPARRRRGRPGRRARASACPVPGTRAWASSTLSGTSGAASVAGRSGPEWDGAGRAGHRLAVVGVAGGARGLDAERCARWAVGRGPAEVVGGGSPLPHVVAECVPGADRHHRAVRYPGTSVPGARPGSGSGTP